MLFRVNQPETICALVSYFRMMRNQMFNGNNGDRPDVRNVGIIFTDGRSNSKQETFNEAVATRKRVSTHL